MPTPNHIMDAPSLAGKEIDGEKLINKRLDGKKFDSIITDEDALTIRPIERAETIPARWYTDPAFHELDREFLFART